VVVKVDPTKTVHRTLRDKANKARNLQGLIRVIRETRAVRVTRETRVVSQDNKVVEETRARDLNPAGQTPIAQVLKETGNKMFPAHRIMNQTWTRT
jgi:hypothetical protein